MFVCMGIYECVNLYIHIYVICTFMFSRDYSNIIPYIPRTLTRQRTPLASAICTSNSATCRVLVKQKES